MSPEGALGREHSSKTDVCAFGLICHEVLTLKNPHFDLKENGDHEKAVFYGGARLLVLSSWTRQMKAAAGVEMCWALTILACPAIAEARRILDKELPSCMVQKLKSSKSWPLARVKTSPHHFSIHIAILPRMHESFFSHMFVDSVFNESFFPTNFLHCYFFLIFRLLYTTLQHFCNTTRHRSIAAFEC
jgi:hypothetical protein